MDEIFTMHILHEHLDEDEKKEQKENENIDELHDIQFVEWDLGHELAQAYIYSQPLNKIFSPKQGLQHGTAFPELFQPYMGRLVVPPCAKEKERI